MLAWFDPSVVTRTSTYFDSVLMAWSRWSISVAADGSVEARPCSLVLMSAIWFIAALACLRRGAEILLDVGAQRLDALGGDVELRRQRLRRTDRNRLRRRRARAGRQRLQRGGEIVQRGFERAAVAGRAIDILKLLQNVGRLVGIAAAAGLGAQLVQHIAVDVAADAGRLRRRAEITGGDFDLVRRLGDVTRRLRVCDVRRDDRQRGLVGTQTAHRTGKG